MVTVRLFSNNKKKLRLWNSFQSLLIVSKLSQKGLFLQTKDSSVAIAEVRDLKFLHSPLVIIIIITFSHLRCLSKVANQKIITLQSPLKVNYHKISIWQLKHMVMLLEEWLFLVDNWIRKTQLHLNKTSKLNFRKIIKILEATTQIFLKRLVTLVVKIRDKAGQEIRSWGWPIHSKDPLLMNLKLFLTILITKA